MNRYIGMTGQDGEPVVWMNGQALSPARSFSSPVAILVASRGVMGVPDRLNWPWLSSSRRG